MERIATTEIGQSNDMRFSAVPPESPSPGEMLDERAFEIDSGACQAMSILLVDDEEDLRRLLCRALRQDGYHVFEAGNGEDALNIAARYGNELRLLVTDLRMPGMTGYELAERLTREWPHVPVLYISGYSEVSPDPDAPFLRKPFHLDALKREVRKLIAPAKAGRKPASRESGCGDSGSRRKRG